MKPHLVLFKVFDHLLHIFQLERIYLRLTTFLFIIGFLLLTRKFNDARIPCSFFRIVPDIQCSDCHLYTSLLVCFALCNYKIAHHLLSVNTYFKNFLVLFLDKFEFNLLRLSASARLGIVFPLNRGIMFYYVHSDASEYISYRL